MAIDLKTFASGDTDYISKLNSDMSLIEAAINSLQQAQAAQADEYTTGLFIDALFQQQTSLVGVDSYKPVPNGQDLTITEGTAYRGSSKTVVYTATTSIGFTAQTPGTYYIAPDASGIPVAKVDDPEDAVWSVVWNGTVFSNIQRIAPALDPAREEDNARKSTTLAEDYTSLDARLEDAEQTAKVASSDAQETADNALALAMRPVYRKIGCTVDDVLGSKGAIQIDFYGEIIGWSVIANVPGELEVEVYRASSDPPPADPGIPTSSDKISASAPIRLTGPSGQQSASASATEVASWANTLSQWDVLEFKLTNIIGIARATLYLLIEEVSSP